MRVYASAEMTLTDTNDGISVTGIDRYYMASSSSEGIKVGSQGWMPEPQETNPISRYHWSYEVVNYSSGPPVPTKPAIIGVYGKEGEAGVDAVTVSLSSEAHTFAGTESKAIASSITIDISAFKGNQRIATSIGTVTGGVTGQLEHSELGRGTTNNKLVINVKSALDKGNGTLSIPIVADGRTFNKVFSWSVAFKGKTGDKGDTGSILGENQWIGHKYSYPGSTRIYPSFDHIQGLNPVATQIFDDSTKFTFNDDYYIAHFQSNLYVNVDKQITTTVIHDDDLTIYCDGEIVVSKNATASAPYNITFNLKAGWNKIDVLLHEISGGDHVTFGTKLSSLVEHLTYIKGSDGVSIVKVDVQYYLSTSNTSLAGGSWSTTAPSWIDGRYMWSKTVTTYTSGLPTESKPVCITGAKGSTGGTGATGRGISSIVEEFYLSDSKTVQPPTSGWSTKMPIWSPGKYIWTRSLITYTAGTPTTSTTEPLVSSEWEAINELEIGGRNLILNSQLVHTGPNNSGLGIATLMNDESTPYYRIIGDRIISTFGFDDSATSNRFSESMIDGATYTVSVDVRAPRTGTVGFYSNKGSQSLLKANEWVRIKYTYTYSGTSFRVIGLTYNSTIIDYRNWKIEKGNTATDWTPAPEDVTASIKAAQDKANAASQEAIAAQADATVGKNMADNLSNDSIITQVEKLELKREWDAIVKEKPSITIQATDYALQGSTEATAYNTAYNSLNGSIPTLLSKMNETSPVNRTTFNTNFANYYDKRQLLLNRIAKKAKELADSAQSSVDNLEIGVRNLLRNSNFIDDFTYWTGITTRELVSDDVFGNVAKVTTTSTTGIIQKPTKQLIVGKEYTLSAYVKAENTSQTVYLAIDGNGVGAAKSHIVPNEWTKISSVFTFSGVNLNIRIYTVGVLYVANVKLEEGNKATDWSPAPEDIQSQIDNKAESEAFNGLVQTVTTETERLNAIDTVVESTKNNFLITHTDEYVNKITTTESTVEGLESRVVSVEETKENVDTFFQFDDAFTIGKSNAQTKLRMTNDEIQFLDGETKGTYITGNTMVSQNMQIQDKLNLPKHTFETEGDITVVKYIG